MDLSTQSGRYRLTIRPMGATRIERLYVADYNTETHHWLRTDRNATSPIGWRSHILPHDSSGPEWVIEQIEPAPPEPEIEEVLRIRAAADAIAEEMSSAAGDFQEAAIKEKGHSDHRVGEAYGATDRALRRFAARVLALGRPPTA